MLRIPPLEDIEFLDDIHIKKQNVRFKSLTNDLRNSSLISLLRAQERPATLILTVTSGLHITHARHVYNRDAETGN